MQKRRQQAPRRQRLFWSVLGRTAVAAVVLGCLTLGALLLLDFQRFVAHRDTLLEEETQRLEAVGALLAGDLEWAVSRTRILADSETLEDYLDQPTPPRQARLQQELMSILSNSGLFDSIRIVDLGGEVRLQADYADGEAVSGEPAPENLAQTRLFAAAAALQPGAVHVSPLTLDQLPPATPQIHIATPLEDSQGTRRALVIVSYSAPVLLDRLRLAVGDGRGEVAVINPDGSGLRLEPLARQAQAVAFTAEQPGLWQEISAGDAGVVEGNGEMFVFGTMIVSGLPYLERLARTELGEPLQTWKLVSAIPPEHHQYRPLSALDWGPGFVGMILVLLAGSSGALGWLRTSNVHQARALELSEEQLSLALEGANEALWDWDLKTDRLYLSDRWKEMLGYAADELDDHRDEWVSRLHPDDREQALADIDQHLRVGEAGYVSRFRLRHRDGHYCWFESRGRALREGGGQPVRVVGTMADVSARVEAEQQLRQAAAVFENTTEAIIIMDRDARITDVNRAFVDITGFSREEALGKRRELLASGSDGDAELFAAIDRGLREQGHWRGEILARRKHGEAFPLWANINLVRANTGRRQHFVAVLTDISAIKESERKLKDLAHHDALTGLPNRLLLKTTLEQALHRAERHHQQLALLFLDLDRFKLINDTLGHAAGDDLLRAIAERLQASVRSEDTVARLGGDEFMVLLEELSEPADAVAPAEKIIHAINRPLQLKGREIIPSTSVGISVYPHHGTDEDSLIKAADAAMYRAKQQGRNKFQFYTRELTERATRRLALEQELRAAVEGGEFELFYQPQVALADHRLTGVEALLRWRHPREGLLAPAHFMAAAEDSGLMEPLGDWVLEQVFRDARHWRQQGLAATRLAINLTSRQLSNPRLLARVRELVMALAPHPEHLQLELEITEATLQTADGDLRALHELQQLGVRLALDDFGTGYSSLNLLRRLPVDMLKIDRSFIAAVPGGTEAEAVVRAIVVLAHSMGLKVLAEGVENTQQVAFLRTEGCDEAQGFLFSEPLPADRVPALLATPQRALR